MIPQAKFSKTLNHQGFQVVPDYHMHTPRCNHATGDIRAYAQAACDAGLSEIGMSDHSPMPHGFDKAWRMDESELSSFIAEVQAAQVEFKGQLSIKSALEVDFYPGAEPYIQHLAAQHNWDYLMGSVHFIGDWGFDNPDEVAKFESCDLEQVYCDYFDVLGQSAATGLFDVIGHPDLIKKFGYVLEQPSSRVEAAEDAMLAAVKAADVVLEISSAGLRKPVAEMYPREGLVEKAAALHIPFTYGSDAHSPAEVGFAMDDCLSVLLKYGIKEVATFRQRKRTMMPLKVITG
ncbi:MAG: histidinol-phosphatase HisJ family protein [Mariprofundaceae bacterium]|nr:histidinol-phosphatase HisJ family protein [Mariprofundaceae bacterium]